MRMARVNITMHDDLYRQARRAGLNVSQLAQGAVTAQLEKLAKLAELDSYLSELDAQFGPTSDAERVDAKAWADRLLQSGGTKTKRSA